MPHEAEKSSGSADAPIHVIVTTLCGGARHSDLDGVPPCGYFLSVCYSFPLISSYLALPFRFLTDTIPPVRTLLVCFPFTL